MYLSDQNWSEEDILEKFYKWRPVYLKRVEIMQGCNPVYQIEWGNVKFENNLFLRSVKASKPPKGADNKNVLDVRLYFTEELSAKLITLKNKKFPKANEVPIIKYDVIKNNPEYPEIIQGKISKAEYDSLLSNVKNNESIPIVLAVQVSDKYNAAFNDQVVESPVLKDNGLYEAEGYEHSVLGSDETNIFSMIKSADADPEKIGQDYTGIVKPLTGTSVSSSFNLDFQAPDLKINWKDLLSKLNINFGSFDLLAAIKDLLPNLNLSCMSESDKLRLKSVNMQSADFVAGKIASGATLASFISDLGLKNDQGQDLCILPQLSGIDLWKLFRIPGMQVPDLSGILKAIPRPDLRGLKWGLDLSKWKIAWFPDKLQGPDVWKQLSGMFNLSLNFRGVKPPQLLFVKLDMSKGLDNIKFNACDTIDTGLDGAMNMIMPKGNAEDTPANSKIIADGMSGNAVLNYLTDPNGMGNTNNMQMADDLASVAIAGAFLGAGGIDQEAIDRVMEFQKIANKVSIGMALLGGLQMTSNPGFAQYLLQGAIGYGKTWAEGTIKAYAFKAVDGAVSKAMEAGASELDKLTDKIPGGNNFPGFGGNKITASQLESMISSETVTKSILGGCESSSIPDLKDIDWEKEIWDMATKVADYIEKYDGTKSDIQKGGKWLDTFSNRNLSAVSANLSKLKRLTIKASGGSDKAPVTLDEEMMGLIGDLLKMLHYVPEPITSGITNIGPIIVSIFNTKPGNLLNTVQNQLGSDNPVIKNMRDEVSKKGTAIMKELKLPDFPKLELPIPIKLDFIPFLGELLNEMLSSLSYGKGQQMNPEQIMKDIDEPGEIGVFYPYRPQAEKPLESYDGAIRGVSTDRAILHVEGWASDYFPQFIQVYGQADNGPVVTTILKIDTTLMTTADGKRGKADWALDIPLPHAGKNNINVWTMNAGGYTVEKKFTAYLAGTSFPQDGSRAVPMTSYKWKAYDNGLFGIGASIAAQGGGIINFLSARLGESAMSDVITAAGCGGKDVRVTYPDDTINPDLVMADINGSEITDNKVPASGQFRFKLKSRYTGRSFITAMGGADALKLSEWRMEYAPGWIDKANTSCTYFSTDGGITASNQRKEGPLFQVMTAWDVWSKRLYGKYTIRTTISDVNMGYDYVSDCADAEVDRAQLTIGTPIDVSNTAGTIVTDPYIKFELFVPAWKVKDTQYVNVYSENIPCSPPLMSDMYSAITSKYGIYPALDTTLLYDNAEPLQITIRYTDEDLDIPGLDSIFGLSSGSADYVYADEKAKAKSIIADNLGIYNETESNTCGAQCVTTTARALIAGTQKPAGAYTAMTKVAQAKGKYYLLPADKPPVLRYPPYASPFIFNPEEESKGRTCTAIYFTPMAATSKYVYADVRITTNESNPSQRKVVRELYDGIEKKEAITLRYSGIYGDIDEYRGEKYYFYNFLTDTANTSQYRSVLSAPVNGITWDGMGDMGSGYGYVPDGVYRAEIRVQDVFGNECAGTCYIVKGRIVPQINQIGGKAASDDMVLNAEADGDTLAVTGIATGGEAFRGYMLGYRPSDYVVMDENGNPDEGYTYLELPEEYTGGAVTTTAKNMQINSGGKLAVWDISSLANGSYDLALFIILAVNYHNC